MPELGPTSLRRLQTPQSPSPREANLGTHGDPHSCLLTTVQGLVLRSGGSAEGMI